LLEASNQPTEESINSTLFTTTNVPNGRWSFVYLLAWNDVGLTGGSFFRLRHASGNLYGKRHLKQYKGILDLRFLCWILARFYEQM
jgi:hypothetical protein